MCLDQYSHHKDNLLKYKNVYLYKYEIPYNNLLNMRYRLLRISFKISGSCDRASLT